MPINPNWQRVWSGMGRVQGSQSVNPGQQNWHHWLNWFPVTVVVITLKNLADKTVFSYTSGGQRSQLVVSVLKLRYRQGCLHLGAPVESLLLPLPVAGVRIPWLVAT